MQSGGEWCSIKLQRKRQNLQTNKRLQQVIQRCRKHKHASLKTCYDKASVNFISSRQCGKPDTRTDKGSNTLSYLIETQTQDMQEHPRRENKAEGFTIR